MASPAFPVLGSILLQLTNDKSLSRKRKRVGVSFDPMDSALRGGVDYGRISCISGDKSQGKTTIAIHLLVTHLLSSPISQAAVIDTTGTFDVLRLHEAIITRVKSKILADRARQIGDLQPEMSPPPPPTEDADKTAEKALDRVKILRVFDFVGVMEAVNELSEELRAEASNVGSERLKVSEEMPQIRPTEQSKPRTEVADSEEEEDEDMLFDSPSPAAEVDASVKPPEVRTSSSLEKIGMIVIDNISQVINPILKSNYVRGQSLLTTFLHSLRHLTTSHDIATILLNSASAPKSAFNASTMNAPQSTWIQEPTAALPSFSDQQSIFSSTTVRPALGKTFTYHVDLHLLLSQLPKRRRDAEIAFGGKAGRGEFVNVIEVLADRVDGRLGLWSVFMIDKSGSLKPAF